MKISMIQASILIVLLSLGKPLLAQDGAGKRTDQPWQVDIATGMHAFYLPGTGAKYSRPEVITTAGLGKPLGAKQAFSVTLQLGYARNNYHGDALFLQLLGQYTPLIANKVEAGIGLGFGYRVAMYGAQPLKWEGAAWKKGRSLKGMYQVPLQFSVGYRSLKLDQYEVRPYVAYQLQALLGYNPDISPLPLSAGLLGIKVQKH